LTIDKSPEPESLVQSLKKIFFQPSGILMGIPKDKTNAFNRVDLQIRPANFIGNNVEPIKSRGITSKYLCVVAKGTCNEI
jgi:hypothetical protein